MAGNPYYDRINYRRSGTNTGTTSGVSTTIAASADATHSHACVGIQCSGDAAAVVTIESPASTVLWQKRFTGAFTHSETFEPGTVVGAANAAMLVKVSASSAHCEANIQTLEGAN